MNFIDKIMEKFGYVRTTKLLGMLRSISEDDKPKRVARKKPTVAKATTRKPATKKAAPKK